MATTSVAFPGVMRRIGRGRLGRSATEHTWGRQCFREPLQKRLALGGSGEGAAENADAAAGSSRTGWRWAVQAKAPPSTRARQLRCEGAEAETLGPMGSQCDASVLGGLGEVNGSRLALSHRLDIGLSFGDAGEDVGAHDIEAGPDALGRR